MTGLDVDALAEQIAARVAEKIDSRALLRMNEAAERLAVARRTLYDMVERGEIRTVTVGKQQRVEQVEVDRYIAANRR